MDWLDILVHTGIAIAAMLALHWIGVYPWAILAVNTVSWPAREAWQHRPNYRAIITRKQPLMEWACPVASGFMIYGVL